MRTLRMRLVLAVAVGVMWSSVEGQDSNTGAFKNTCTRACGAYETCVVVDGVESCAAYCAPGRCEDATQVCMVQARACTSSPCLPAAVCVPKSSQILGASVTLSEDDSPAAAACARQCPMANAPVCSSDGVSYSNSCFFEQARCLDPTLTLAYAQLCQEDVDLNAQYNPSAPTAPGAIPIDPTTCNAIVCSSVEDPVCTSAGSMRNLCEWTKAKCLQPGITLLSRTSCDASPLMPACPTSCTQEFVPVCGSNGLLYGNECLFRMAKCERQAFAELKARDLSYCELQVGDSEGMASEINELLVTSLV